jgi:3-hydroxybutyryl-CoA dehydrogenase
MMVKRVGVVGAGTMGSGIATNIAQHGYPVHIVDMGAAQVDGALSKARTFYQRQAERGRMSEADVAAATARLQGSTDLGALAGCDLVIEAVFEQLEVKAELYGRLIPVLGPECLVATNTSCLQVGALARSVDRPERFLGMHYFNPPAVNPIVEVVCGEKTHKTAIDAALAFCAATKKMPVLCRDRSGFALNRFFCPYINEAVRLYDDGIATPFEVDRVASDVLGAAAGPFVVINLVGTRVMLHAQSNLVALGKFYEPAKSVVRVGEKAGTWEIGDPSPPDAARDKTVADRLLGATFLALLQELDEDVASPADIDLGARHAFKFGKPPCALMDVLGRAEVERLVRPFCETYGASLPGSLARVGMLIAQG